jgi:PAS domain S-box-containing protein
MNNSGFENKDKKVKELYEELFVLQRTIEDFWRVVPIPLCSTNPVLNILEVGEKFKEVFQYARDEIIGENLSKIFLREEEFEKTKKKLFLHQKLEGEEVVLISKNGKESINNIYAKPKEDSRGEIIGYTFSFLDITGKKKAEKELQKKIKDFQKLAEELKDSRAALLNILEDAEEARAMAEIERDKTLAIVKNFPEGLLFFDEKNLVSSANPKIEEIFSISLEEVLGKSAEELKEMEQLSVLGELIVDEKGDIKEISEKEVNLKEDVILEISSIRITKKGEKVGMLVIVRDITRTKLIERLKTEFVSVAAHQLRTPLSAIKWTLRMLLDGDIGKITKEQRDFLEKTYKSNERMIHLINDLLNVTRIEEGRFLYNVRVQDIIEVAEKVITPLKEVAERKNVKLVFETPSLGVPLTSFDAEKISLVIQNLVENAINYNRPGGEVKVSVNYLREKKEIIFSVSDTGIGIPKEQQQRVFSRFFRATNAVRVDTEGTGLGLYIAKNIIKAHNGKIWFKSQEGKGSTFYFTLPVR